MTNARKEVIYMQLMTKEIRKKLPPLYSQEELGGKAVAVVKFFTPDSSWSFFGTYAELHISCVMWSYELCRVSLSSYCNYLLS